MLQRSLLAVLCAIVIASATSDDALSAQANPSNASLAGQWRLNFQLSQFPREIGFAADWMAGAATADDSSGGGGGRRRGASGVAAPFVGPQESADDAARLEVLTGEVRSPSVRLTIAETPAAITITDDRDQSRTFHPDGRDDELHLGDVPVGVVARWETGKLVIVYHVAQGRDLRYTYSTISNTTPPQLAVDVQFVERGGHDATRYIYNSRPVTAPPAPRRAAEDPKSAEALRNPTPAVPQGADPELKGLARLGLVVEGLNSAAAGCGLTQSAIETAVTKSLTDAGFRVRTNSDEDTYVYVNILTGTMGSGFCVSRYDASLYSHAMTKLSYQETPVLVQVELLHKGGIAGGAPAAHAESLLKGLKEYVDEFAGRIRAAGK